MSNNIELNTDNPEYFTWQYEQLQIGILGGLKIEGLDRMGNVPIETCVKIKYVRELINSQLLCCLRVKKLWIEEFKMLWSVGKRPLHCVVKSIVYLLEPGLWNVVIVYPSGQVHLFSEAGAAYISC